MSCSSGNIQDVYRNLLEHFNALKYFASKEQLDKLDSTNSGNIWELIRVLEHNIAVLKGSGR